VPSIMVVMGRWNWWLPPRIAGVLRVRPSAAVPDRSVSEPA
jgi:uncharacterized membrane protein YdfJ with MMPL/SSD domain